MSPLPEMLRGHRTLRPSPSLRLRSALALFVILGILPLTGGVATGAPGNASTTTYAVIFSEQGLPGGALWSVNVSGHLYSTTNQSLTIDAANGTYSYVAYSAAAGPGQRYVNGTLTVTGRGETIPLYFAPAAASGPALSSLGGGAPVFLWMAVVLFVALIAFATIGLSRGERVRRRAVQAGPDPHGSVDPASHAAPPEVATEEEDPLGHML